MSPHPKRRTGIGATAHRLGHLAFVLIVGLSTYAAADTVTLSTADNQQRAGLNNQTFVVNFEQTYAGYTSDTVQVGALDDGYHDARAAWFFDASSITEEVTAVTLRIPRGSYSSADASRTVNFYGLQTFQGGHGIETLVSPRPLAYYPQPNNFQYASVAVASGAADAMIEIPLNAKAVAAMNNIIDIGLDARFFGVSGIMAVDDDASLVLQSNAAAQLVVTTVPEPAAWVLMGVAVLILGAMNRRNWSVMVARG